MAAVFKTKKPSKIHCVYVSSHRESIHHESEVMIATTPFYVCIVHKNKTLSHTLLPTHDS
jgi:hypothetical protein